MKIYNEIILNWNDKSQQFETVYEDSYDYDGPVDRLSTTCTCAEDANCPDGYYCQEGAGDCETSGNRTGLCVESSFTYACLDPSATNYCETTDSNLCTQCGCTGERCVECVNFTEICTYENPDSRQTCPGNDYYFADSCGNEICLPRKSVQEDYQYGNGKVEGPNASSGVGPGGHYSRAYVATCGGVIECYANGGWSHTYCNEQYMSDEFLDDYPNLQLGALPGGRFRVCDPDKPCRCNCSSVNPVFTHSKVHDTYTSNNPNGQDFTENHIENYKQFDVCWWNSGWLPWNKGIWGEYDPFYSAFEAVNGNAAGHAMDKIDLNDGNGLQWIGMFDAAGHCTSAQEPPGGWVGRDCSGACVGIEDDLGHGAHSIPDRTGGDEQGFSGKYSGDMMKGKSYPPYPFDIEYESTDPRTGYRETDKCAGAWGDSGLPQGFGAGCGGSNKDIPSEGMGSCAVRDLPQFYAYPERLDDSNNAGVCFGGINHNMPCCGYTDCPGLAVWDKNDSGNQGANRPMPWLPEEVRKPGGNLISENEGNSPYHSDEGTCGVCICGAEYNVFDDKFGRSISSTSHRCQPTFNWSIDMGIYANSDDNGNIYDYLETCMETGIYPGLETSLDEEIPPDFITLSQSAGNPFHALYVLGNYRGNQAAGSDESSSSPIAGTIWSKFLFPWWGSSTNSSAILWGYGEGGGNTDGWNFSQYMINYSGFKIDETISFGNYVDFEIDSFMGKSLSSGKPGTGNGIEYLYEFDMNYYKTELPAILQDASDETFPFHGRTVFPPWWSLESMGWVDRICGDCIGYINTINSTTNQRTNTEYTSTFHAGNLFLAGGLDVLGFDNENVYGRVISEHPNSSHQYASLKGYYDPDGQEFKNPLYWNTSRPNYYNDPNYPPVAINKELLSHVETTGWTTPVFTNKDGFNYCSMIDEFANTWDIDYSGLDEYGAPGITGTVEYLMNRYNFYGHRPGSFTSYQSVPEGLGFVPFTGYRAVYDGKPLYHEHYLGNQDESNICYNDSFENCSFYTAQGNSYIIDFHNDYSNGLQGYCLGSDKTFSFPTSPSKNSGNQGLDNNHLPTSDSEIIPPQDYWFTTIYPNGINDGISDEGGVSGFDILNEISGHWVIGSYDNNTGWGGEDPSNFFKSTWRRFMPPPHITSIEITRDATYFDSNTLVVDFKSGINSNYTGNSISSDTYNAWENDVTNGDWGPSSQGNIFIPHEGYSNGITTFQGIYEEDRINIRICYEDTSSTFVFDKLTGSYDGPLQSSIAVRHIADDGSRNCDLKGPSGLGEQEFVPDESCPSWVDYITFEGYTVTETSSGDDYESCIDIGWRFKKDFNTNGFDSDGNRAYFGDDWDTATYFGPGGTVGEFLGSIDIQAFTFSNYYDTLNEGGVQPTKQIGWSEETENMIGEPALVFGQLAGLSVNGSILKNDYAKSNPIQLYLTVDAYSDAPILDFTRESTLDNFDQCLQYHTYIPNATDLGSVCHKTINENAWTSDSNFEFNVDLRDFLTDIDDVVATDASKYIFEYELINLFDYYGTPQYKSNYLETPGGHELIVDIQQGISVPTMTIRGQQTLNHTPFQDDYTTEVDANYTEQFYNGYCNTRPSESPNFDTDSEYRRNLKVRCPDFHHVRAGGDCLGIQFLKESNIQGNNRWYSPEAYYEIYGLNSHDEAEMSQFNCNYDFSNVDYVSLNQISMIRAVCADGTTVNIEDSGVGASQQADYPEDFDYNTGNAACLSNANFPSSESPTVQTDGIEDFYGIVVRVKVYESTLDFNNGNFSQDEFIIRVEQTSTWDCMDNWSDDYSDYATQDDLTCTYQGCTHPLAKNFLVQSVHNNCADSGTCPEALTGDNIPEGYNYVDCEPVLENTFGNETSGDQWCYNPNLTQISQIIFDDGSCVFDFNPYIVNFGKNLGNNNIDFNEPLILPPDGTGLDPRFRYSDTFGINAGLRYNQFDNSQSSPIWVSNEVVDFESYTHPQTGDNVDLQSSSNLTKFITYYPQIDMVNNTPNPVYGTLEKCDDAACTNTDSDVWDNSDIGSQDDCINCFENKYFGKYISNTKTSDPLPAHIHFTGQNADSETIAPLSPWPFFCEPFNEIWSDMVSAQIGVRTKYYGQFVFGNNVDLESRKSDIMTWPGIQMYNTGFCEYCDSNVSQTEDCVNNCTSLEDCASSGNNIIKVSDGSITSEICERRCDYIDSEGNCGKSGDWQYGCNNIEIYQSEESYGTEINISAQEPFGFIDYSLITSPYCNTTSCNDRLTELKSQDEKFNQASPECSQCTRIDVHEKVLEEINFDGEIETDVDNPIPGKQINGGEYLFDSSYEGPALIKMKIRDAELTYGGISLRLNGDYIGNLGQTEDFAREWFKTKTYKFRVGWSPDQYSAGNYDVNWRFGGIYTGCDDEDCTNGTALPFTLVDSDRTPSNSYDFTLGYHVGAVNFRLVGQAYFDIIVNVPDNNQGLFIKSKNSSTNPSDSDLQPIDVEVEFFDGNELSGEIVTNEISPYPEDTNWNYSEVIEKVPFGSGKNQIKWIYTTGFNGLQKTDVVFGQNILDFRSYSGTDGGEVEWIKVEKISDASICGEDVNCGVKDSDKLYCTDGINHEECVEEGASCGSAVQNWLTAQWSVQNFECVSGYESIGWGTVQDQSTNAFYNPPNDQLIDDDNITQIQKNYGFIYDDGTLTEQGLMAYQYDLYIKPPYSDMETGASSCNSFDYIIGSCNILYPGLEINDVVIQGEVDDVDSFRNDWESSSNLDLGVNEFEVQLVGFRNVQTNECCGETGGGDIYCEFGLQTRFKIRNWYDYGNNQYYEDYVTEDGVANFSDGTEPLSLIYVQSKFDAFILNSPLKFCTGDQILKDSNRGVQSQRYNIVFPGSIGNESENGIDSDYGLITDNVANYAFNGTNESLVYYLDDITRAELTSLTLNVKRTIGDTVINLNNFQSHIPSEAVDYNIPERNLAPIKVNVVSANAPKIHSITYLDSTMSPMLGVQNNELVEYNNFNKNLISTEYLQQVHPVTGDENKTDVDGYYSIGNIDFQPYELIPQYENDGGFSIFVSSQLGTVTISNEFDLGVSIDDDSGRNLYIWDKVVNAINSFTSEPCNYEATLDPYSHPDPASSIKRIVVKSLSVGEECNGILSWNVPDEFLFTENPGDLFNPLIDGKTFPILHVYEDFGEINLRVVSSDVDALSAIYFDVVSSNSSVVEAEMDGELDLTVNPIGDGTTSGGTSNIPDLITQSDTDGAGESIAIQNIKLTSQDLTNLNTNQDGEFLLKDYNGEVDIAVRAIDDNAMSDLYVIRLKIHPVNDPPIIEYATQSEILVNNQYYPNDANIELKLSDIESSENYLSRGDIYQVTQAHCDEIENKILEFTNWYVNPIYRTNLILSPYDFRYLWHWQIWDGDVTPGDYYSNREYYYDENYSSETSQHEITCVDESETQLESDFAECNTIKFYTNHSVGSPRFFSGDIEFNKENNYVLIVDWKPINVEDMQGVFIRGPVVDNQTYNEINLGNLQEAGENLGNGWWRNQFTIYSENHSSATLGGNGTDGRIGFYPHWGTDSENEFYLRNIKLVEMSEGASEAQFPEYNCTNMMYCTTACYDNPVLENGVEVDTGRTKEQMEYECSFADYNQDGVLGIEDIGDTEGNYPDSCNDDLRLYGSTLEIESMGWKGGYDLPQNNEDSEIDVSQEWVSQQGPNFFDIISEADWSTQSGNPKLFAFNKLISGDFLPIYIKKYINIVPKQDSIGSSLIRMSIEDNGLNEDGSFSHIRTGFSKALINVGGIDTTGAQGNLLSIQKASFGLTTDTYQYFVNGEDDRDEQPTTLNYGAEVHAYKYHSDTTESNRMISSCGALTSDTCGEGFVNSLGECCCSIKYDFSSNYPFLPTDDVWLHYFNTDKNYYYENEFREEVQFFADYFIPEKTPIVSTQGWCHGKIENISWEYGDYIPNKNKGAFKSKNIDINEIDNVISYEFIITDLIERYDVTPDTYTCDGVGGEATDGSSTDACYEGDITWWNNFNEDTESWVSKWENLANNGWQTSPEISDEVYMRGINHPYGDKGITIFSSGEIQTSNIELMDSLLDDGYTFRFDYPSVYEVSVLATDTYGFIGKTSEIVDARNIVALEQTVLHKFNPFRGSNITGTQDVENSESHIDGRDLDKRPTLGLFTYDELNIEKSWFIKHADAYSGLEGNYTGSICNETFNCSGVYSNSPSYNLLNFSNINYAIVNDYGDNQHMLSNTWIKSTPNWTSYNGLLLENSDIPSPDSNNFYTNYDALKITDLYSSSNTYFQSWAVCNMPFTSVPDMVTPDEHSNKIEYATYDNIDSCRDFCVAHDYNYFDLECVEEYLGYGCADDECNIWLYKYQYTCTGDNSSGEVFYAENENEASAKNAARNACNAGCYSVKYGQNEIDAGFGIDVFSSPFDGCERISDSDLDIPSLLNLRTNGITQTVQTDTNVITDDLIFSTYLHNDALVADMKFSSIGIVLTLNDGTIYKKYKTIDWQSIIAGTNIDSTIGVIYESENGTCTNAVCENTDNQMFDGQPCQSNSDCRWEQHPEYYGSEIKMFWVEDAGDGWYKFYVRVSPKYEDGGLVDVPISNITTYTEPSVGGPDGKFFEGWIAWEMADIVYGTFGDNRTISKMNVVILPSSKNENDLDSWNSTTDALSVSVWGNQVETIKPYEDVTQVYQPTRSHFETGIYDFYPDVDVRNPLSLDSDSGNYSVLTKYYDDELQAGSYLETSAPLTAQLYFYIRDNANDKLFEEKKIVSFNPKSLYVGFLDWGDGSKIEYDKEPFELKESSILTHVYEKSGIYDIKGEMFNVVRDLNENVLGVAYFKEFVARINVNVNSRYEEEFKLLGGQGYDFIPYSKTTPLVSGVSDFSSYKKNIKRTLGYLPGNEDPIPVKFKYYSDRLKTELALAQIDEKYIGQTIKDWTGKFPNELFTNGVTPTIDVRITVPGAPDEIVSVEDAPRGFYSGSVNPVDGKFKNEGELLLVNKGIDTNYEELGDYLGDTDLAQVRYLDKPYDMWQMLGFECDDYFGYDVLPIDSTPSDRQGHNYSNHSDHELISVNNGDPFNTTSVLSRISDDSDAVDNTNHTRFGYRFKIDTGGVGELLYNNITTANLAHGKTYVYSSYVYLPDGQGEFDTSFVQENYTSTRQYMIINTVRNEDWSVSSYCKNNIEDDFYISTRRDNHGNRPLWQTDIETSAESFYYIGDDARYCMNTANFEVMDLESGRGMCMVDESIAPRCTGDDLSNGVGCYNSDNGIPLDTDQYYENLEGRVQTGLSLVGSEITDGNQTYRGNACGVIGTPANTGLIERVPMNYDTKNEWQRIYITFQVPEFTHLRGYGTEDEKIEVQTGELLSIRMGTPMCCNNGNPCGSAPYTDGCGKFIYTWGSQIEEVEMDEDGNIVSTQPSEYAGNVDIDPDNCRRADAGTPDNERYYKNIVPEDYNLFLREGIDYWGWEPGQNCGVQGIGITFCVDENHNIEVGPHCLENETYISLDGFDGTEEGCSEGYTYYSPYLLEYSWNLKFPSPYNCEENNDCQYLFMGQGNVPLNYIIDESELDSTMCDKFVTGADCQDPYNCVGEGEWASAVPCKGCFTYRGFPKIGITEDDNPWRLQLYTNYLPSDTGGGGVHAIVHWVDEEPWGGNNVNNAEVNVNWGQFTEQEIEIDESDERYADDCGVCMHPECTDGDESLQNLINNPCPEGQVPGNFRWNQEC